MSGSEPRLMGNRGGEAYGMSLQIPSSSVAGGGGTAVMSSACLDFNSDPTAVYKPIMPNSPTYHQHPMAANAPVEDFAEPVKRKRGRPRKNSLDASVGLAPQQQPISSPGNGFPGAVSPSSGKRGRGRPPGSGRRQIAAATALGYGCLGSAGVGFTPHIVTVKAGEDIASQILSYIQNGGRAVCVLSATGAISNVTLCQSATSGGSITYEGRFDIISLSGSFMLSESGGQRSRTGGLSVSLAGHDGNVLGGCVAGLLIAASPIQMVVGSFIVGGQKQTLNSENQARPIFVPPLKVVGAEGGNNLTPIEASGDPINHRGQGVNMAWK